MTDNQNDNKRIAKNTVFLYLRMFFVLIVGLYTSRVVLNTLGVADYGTYNVVAGFVSMFGFLNATLSSSMQRFYNYEGTKCGEEGYKKVYATGFIIHIVLGALLFAVLESFGLWYVNSVMVVPEGRLMAVNVIYQVSILSMILVIFQIPYTGAIMAKEHMDFYAYVSILDVVLKLAAIITLPFLPFDKLITYAFLLLAISLFDTVCYVVYANKKILPRSERLRLDKGIFSSLMAFSSWNLLGTIIFMFKGQGLNMMLNIFFGPVVNAARGIANQVSSAVTSFSSNLMTAYRPQIVNSYADANYDRTKRLMFSESKICFFLLLLLITPVCIEIEYILKLWLGDIVPAQSSTFAILVLVDALICTLNTPCTQVVWAVGKIRLYQILTACINILLLPLCYIVLRLGYDATSVFIMTIFISCMNQLVALYATNKLFSFGLLDYIKEVVIPLLISTVLVVLPQLTISLFMESSLGRLIVIGLVDAILALPVLYFIVADKSEKNLLVKVLRKITLFVFKH